jgi:hypothetical protein
MITKATYGDQVTNEMGKDLAHWNVEAVDVLAEACFSFWLVDVLHFCGWNCVMLQLKIKLKTNSTVYPRLGSWITVQVGILAILLNGPY